jgi:hypothetical protein
VDINILYHRIDGYVGNKRSATDRKFLIESKILTEEFDLALQIKSKKDNDSGWQLFAEPINRFLPEN